MRKRGEKGIKRVAILMFLWVVSLSMLIGCNGAESSIQYSINMENSGGTYKTGEFTPCVVTIRDDKDNALSVEHVYLFINMVNMNHPMEGTMEEIKTGMYRIELPLSMAGEWYAEVTVKNGEDEVSERFTIFAEGERVMEFMHGYNLDE